MFAIAVSAQCKYDITTDYSPVYLNERPSDDWVITMIARGILYDNCEESTPHIIHISSDDQTWVEFARFDDFGNPTEREFEGVNPQHSFDTSFQLD